MHRGLGRTDSAVIPPLRDIRPYVSDAYIKILFEELQKIGDKQEPNPARQGDNCWCPVKRVCGLPCFHKLHWMQHHHQRVELSDIHPFWFWNRKLITLRHVDR